jgi:hypothetical protein
VWVRVCVYQLERAWRWKMAGGRGEEWTVSVGQQPAALQQAFVRAHRAATGPARSRPLPARHRWAAAEGSPQGLSLTQTIGHGHKADEAGKGEVRCGYTSHSDCRPKLGEVRIDAAKDVAPWGADPLFVGQGEQGSAKWATRTAILARPRDLTAVVQRPFFPGDSQSVQGSRTRQDRFGLSLSSVRPRDG